MISRSFGAGALYAFVSITVISCASEEPKQADAVIAEPTKFPDSPGDAGETDLKPAGEGAASGGEQATPSEVEKSQPNVSAAAEAAKGKMPAADAEMPVLDGPGGAMKVVPDGLNVRNGPGMKFDVLRVLRAGEAVSASACSSIWCKIGEGEYAGRKFLEPAP